MESVLSQYLNSTWGVFTNLAVFILFGLASYDTYAKRWSAKTGKYKTTGRITWSGEIPGNKPPYLVSYSYNIDGALYNGELYIPPYRVKKTLEENPKGKEITIYYAAKDHGFSRALKPPNHSQIIGKSVFQYLIIPIIFVNIFSIYLYWLINASK